MGVLDLSDYGHNFGFFSTDGTKTGPNNADQDYSANPTDFFMQLDENVVGTVSRIVVSMMGRNLGQGGYGGPDPLANPITITKTDRDGNLIYDFTSGVGVSYEEEWGSYCYDISPVRDSWRRARWTFSKADNQPVILEHRERLVATYHGDMTGFIFHRIHAQGKIANYLYGRK